MAVVSICGYSVDVDALKASTCGAIGFAKKGGTRYFCKKFNIPVEPANNGALSPKAIAKNREQFENFKRRKLRLNNKLREISGLGGNIVFPIDETVYDHHWMEFSEFIEDTIPEEQYAEIIRSLTPEQRLLVLKIAIGALQTIHSQHIVHGDLKLTNIMLVRNSYGNYVSKIIDFDGAFFEDDVPLDSITGTTDYFSPELAMYSINEEEEGRKFWAAKMTTKSDIFTMGLILHEYLTGEKPQPESLPSALQKMKDAGKFIYPWQVLLIRDKGQPPHQLKISRAIKEPAYVALISDMLCLDPTKRPSAVEVLARLNAPNTLPIELAPWPEHNITIQEAAVKEHLVALRKTEVKSKDGTVEHLYELVDKDGLRYIKTKDDLVSVGLASPGEAWDAPWPEDNITVNLDKIKPNFTSFTRGERPGYYRLYDRRGNCRIISCAMLKNMGFATAGATASAPAPVTPPVTKTPTPPTPPVSTSPVRPVMPPPIPEPTPKPVTPAPAPAPVPPTPKPVTPTPSPMPVDDTLWPAEKGFLINHELLEKQGWAYVGKATMNGANCYQFRDKTGNIRSLPAQTSKILKYLIPKG